MSPNTILQINKFHYMRGGAERYYFNLSELLERYGHRVVHFSMQDPKNIPSEFSQYFVSKMDISRVSFSLAGVRKAMRLLYSFESKSKIEQIIKDTKPDIAHIHNIYHQISPSILPVLKKFKIPVVMSLHDYKLISPNYQFLCNGKICEHKNSYSKEIFHKTVKNSYVASALCALEMKVHIFFDVYKRNIDLFLAPSEFIKNKFVEYGFDSDKIKVLPYALEIESYRDISPVNGPRYIVYFGRLSKEKGIDILLNAIKNIKNDVKLKIAGEGPMLEQLKLKIKNESIQNIEFVDFKSGDELKNIIAGSLFVVVPSIWYENSPLAIYEAMALGKAVIGSRIGGIPELVKENITGLLFEAGNSQELATKINYLLDNEEILIKMGKEAKEIAVEKFGYDEHYKQINAIYSQL